MNATRIYSKVISRNYFWKRRKVDFGKYKIVEPRCVSKQMTVPDHIAKPSYHLSGEPTENIIYPEIKNEEQLKRMRESGKLAAKILEMAGEVVEVGTTTDEIDIFVFNACMENGAYPSPLNYKKFPKSVCTSVNNVVVHGIPDDRPLEDGDIINIDITVFLNGYHGDCSKTFLVGNVDIAGRKLVEVTENCLYEAISICKPDQHFKEIGACIEDMANKSGYQVVPAFIGHGIGSYFHGPPDIFHIRNNYYPGRMSAGMTFTIEPVLTQGEEMVEILEDDWTAVTVDSARTAQFEHTILITNNGAEILTLPD